MSSGSLTRSRSDRMVAGVCGGLAEHLAVDPARIRTTFVLTTVFGGAGAVVYAVLWAVIPDAAHEDAQGHEALHNEACRR